MVEIEKLKKEVVKLVKKAGEATISYLEKNLGGDYKKQDIIYAVRELIDERILNINGYIEENDGDKYEVVLSIAKYKFRIEEPIGMRFAEVFAIAG